MKIKSCAECHSSTPVLKEFAHSKKAVVCECGNRGELFFMTDKAILRWNKRQDKIKAFNKMCKEFSLFGA